MLISEVKSVNKNQIQSICNVAKKMNLQVSYTTTYNDNEYSVNFLQKTQIFSVY